jgi:murein L,D-transpeptidase YcbB/YkuD
MIAAASGSASSSELSLERLGTALGAAAGLVAGEAAAEAMQCLCRRSVNGPLPMHRTIDASVRIPFRRILVYCQGTRGKDPTCMHHVRNLVLALTAAALPGSASAADWLKDDPYTLPEGGQKGLDMVMVDAAAMPQEPELARDDLPLLPEEEWSGAPVDLLKPVHHLYTDLRRALVRYQMEWSGLPVVRIPETGPVLALASTDRRVPSLRKRLGLGDPDPLAPSGFDAPLEAKLRAYQAAHGLPADGKAGAATIRSLNLGPKHYEALAVINMERARRLPPPGGPNSRKYILVDAAGAKLIMYEDGRPVDSMKVIVGTDQSPTPMMAALMRYANVNPYWNIPPDLVAKTIAPRVLAEGPQYLIDRRYEVLDTWENDAKVIDPTTVDWKAVAAGKEELRVRQLPGGTNSMGEVKFMLPNNYGIYLHDTPGKDLFAKDGRHLSNGCVRLEDARRLARWVFGEMPAATSPDAEQRVDLKEPIPVYITYMTAGLSGTQLAFRADAYGRDRALLARFDPLGPSTKVTAR